MKACKCGCREFIGHQICRMDIIVDADNQFIENIAGGIYDSETPYGPYTCRNCGEEYESLDDLPDVPCYLMVKGPWEGRVLTEKQTEFFYDVLQDHIPQPDYESWIKDLLKKGTVKKI